MAPRHSNGARPNPILPSKKPRYRTPDPDNPEQLRNNPRDDDYFERKYLVQDTPAVIYAPDTTENAEPKERQLLSQFGSSWIANTSTGAALTFNTYWRGALRIAAIQQQTPTEFENFLAYSQINSPTQLAVLTSRHNIIRKNRQITGIKAPNLRMEKLPSFPTNRGEQIQATANYAQAEIEHHPAMLNTLTRTLPEINEKTYQAETPQLLRCVQNEADRKRFPNGQAIQQQFQQLQQSTGAQTIRQDSQYIELVQTRNNFQNWCNQKTGKLPPTAVQFNPHLEDPNYGLKLSIAEFLHKKLYPIAESHKNRTETDLEKKIDATQFQKITDQEFLQGIQWPPGKHPVPQQLHMLREALTTAAHALNNPDETHLNNFLSSNDKTSSTGIQEIYQSRAMQILWVSGAEAHCKLGEYKTANRKLQTDLNLAFHGTVLERLIHLVKTHLQYGLVLQQMIGIHNQVRQIAQNTNRNHHGQSLNNMNRMQI